MVSPFEDSALVGRVVEIGAKTRFLAKVTLWSVPNLYSGLILKDRKMAKIKESRQAVSFGPFLGCSPRPQSIPLGPPRPRVLIWVGSRATKVGGTKNGATRTIPTKARSHAGIKSRQKTNTSLAPVAHTNRMPTMMLIKINVRPYAPVIHRRVPQNGHGLPPLRIDKDA